MRRTEERSPRNAILCCYHNGNCNAFNFHDCTPVCLVASITGFRRLFLCKKTTQIASVWIKCKVLIECIASLSYSSWTNLPRPTPSTCSTSTSHARSFQPWLLQREESLLELTMSLTSITLVVYNMITSQRNVRTLNDNEILHSQTEISVFSHTCFSIFRTHSQLFLFCFSNVPSRMRKSEAFHFRALFAAFYFQNGRF